MSLGCCEGWINQVSIGKGLVKLYVYSAPLVNTVSRCLVPPAQPPSSAPDFVVSLTTFISKDVVSSTTTLNWLIKGVCPRHNYWLRKMSQGRELRLYSRGLNWVWLIGQCCCSSPGDPSWVLVTWILGSRRVVTNSGAGGKLFKPSTWFPCP